MRTNRFPEPKIEVLSDFDGYFEAMVRRWVQQMKDSGTLFKSQRILITAGPYRACAVSAEVGGIDNEQLTLDFYSALRTGFGSLSESDVAQIKGDWL